MTNSMMRSALVLLATCGLFACAAEGTTDDTTTDKSANEPTLFSGERDTTADDGRSASDLGDLSRATGATARIITYNHPAPHSLAIPMIDLAKGKGGIYAMTEGGGAYGELHQHTVTVSAQELSQIADGASLTFESSVGGKNPHTHTVTVAKR